MRLRKTLTSNAAATPKTRKPYISAILLGLIALACLLADVLAPYEAGYMDSLAVGLAPCSEYLLGTDNLGRDLLSMLLYGGRISLYIGILSTAISTAFAVVCGSIAGLAGRYIDGLLMSAAELLMSIPNLLLVLFLQAIWGQATPTSIAVVIAAGSWMNMAKIVRSEVRQIGQSDYILAARLMEADFPYILRKHLLPNFLPAILFMIVTNVGGVIIAETTLSFLGLGLPVSTVSWGSLLSLSKSALLSNQWWTILLPGLVLITTLVSITQIGEFLRKKNTRLHSNL